MLGAFLGVTVFTLIIHNLYNMHITAVFSDLEPFPKNLNVYYKGLKLGRTVRVHPSKDFTDTHVEMILNAKNLSLPDNTTAKMKSKNKKDYEHRFNKSGSFHFQDHRSVKAAVPRCFDSYETFRQLCNLLRRCHQGRCQSKPHPDNRRSHRFAVHHLPFLPHRR